jgi:hypothetical protein
VHGSWPGVNAGIDPPLLDGWLYIPPCPVQLGAVIEVDRPWKWSATSAPACWSSTPVHAAPRAGGEQRHRTGPGRPRRRTYPSGRRLHRLGHPPHRQDGVDPARIHRMGRRRRTDLRLKAEDGNHGVTVEKHKDGPSGVYNYRLLPHTVSRRSCPALTRRAESLGRFPKRWWEFWRNSHRSWEKVGILCGIPAASKGCQGRSSSSCAKRPAYKSSAYRAVNVLIDRGFLRNVGTGSNASTYTKARPG